MNKKQTSEKMGIKVEIITIFSPKRTNFLNIKFLYFQTYFSQINFFFSRAVLKLPRGYGMQDK
jgi:hypothetical protein